VLCVECRVTLDELFARQDGIISIAQAREHGVSRAALHRRVQTGSLVAVGRGVYRSAQHPPSHEARLRAVVLGAGPKSVAYGPSAAWWHGLLDKAPSRCWVTIPLKRRTLRTTAHEIRRRDLKPEYKVCLRGLFVTSLALTVLEAAVESPGGSVLMDQALQTRVNLADLQKAHQDNLGRTGSAAAGLLLASAAGGGRSEAERLLHRILEGFSGWVAQYRVGRYAIDVAFPEARLAIEVDGWAFHGNASRFHNDLRRHNVIENAGWRVLRFDWHRLVEDPAGVAAEISAALR
jgi:very-short-patch-repair endonuclease